MGKLLALKIAPAARAALIDEYGAVTALRLAFGPTEKRYTQLRDEIKSWYEDADAELDYVEKGARYQLDVSPAANVRTIDIRVAYKKLGIAKFLKAASLTLTALAKFLSEDEIGALTTTDRTGARSYAVTPIAAAPARPTNAPDQKLSDSLLGSA